MLTREKLARLFTEYSTVVAYIVPLIGVGYEDEGLLPIENMKKYLRGMHRNMIDV